MTHHTAVFFRDGDRVPVLEWLREMARRDKRIVAKLQVRIERLAQLGHELGRPEADYLRDGIYELRARLGSTNYRILYAFCGQSVAVLVHGLTKERDVPDGDIELAVRRREQFEQHPELHTYERE